MHNPAPNKFVMLVFLAMVGAPALFQTLIEARRGEHPQVLGLFGQRPTPGQLKAFEKSLENESVVIRWLRPWMQAATYVALADAGENALVGREGWFFYNPGVRFLTQRPQPDDSAPSDALSAVIHFRDSLASRGIRLLLVPAPNKESIYPDKLTRFAAPAARILSPDTRSFLSQCQASGVEVLDLFALFREARKTSAEPLYLRQDSHWSPAGMEIAARAVAERILAREWLTPGPVGYDRRSVPVRQLGDIPRMARSPQLEQLLVPESVTATQILLRDSTTPYTDDPASEVLVLGDSFLRIYQREEPGNGGFIAHLALGLCRPIASIVNDGGASTLVRQELFRRPHLLHNKKVVVWEFVERDLRFGTEGWQPVPLPPASTPPHTAWLPPASSPAHY